MQYIINPLGLGRYESDANIVAATAIYMLTGTEWCFVYVGVDEAGGLVMSDPYRCWTSEPQFGCPVFLHSRHAMDAHEILERLEAQPAADRAGAYDRVLAAVRAAIERGEATRAIIV